MTKIVAIGGGEIARGETEPIDQYICELADHSTPQALFVPTASGDASEYCNLFDNYYGDKLGCHTRHLTLHSDEVGTEQIRTDLDWADFVYVGGGSLPLLLDCWQECGVDPLLYEAYQEGTIMTGLSAGAMCWFASGLTDSVDKTEYTLVDCLGWISNIACTPHATSERRSVFQEILETRHKSGVALENGCAIEITDNQYRILSAGGEETAHNYGFRDGLCHCSELHEDDYADLSALS
jgi:dipeptidase E